jgi:cysteine desulfurase
MRRIYLDHAATTPPLPEVLEATTPWLSAHYGNPSSLHAEGRQAKDAIDASREVLSEALGCLFAEVLFTGSGTEAANLALVGAALANGDASRNRILMGAAEHHCVLHTKDLLRSLGYHVELVPVDRIGRLRLDVLADRIDRDVLLVSAMHANNELGTLQPAREIADLAHTLGALFHCDAVQAFLQPAPSPWKVADLDADLLTLSAHKVNGPKGAGAIYIRAGIKLKPLTVGGGQEREMRAGTENVAAIVGFAEAVRWHRAHPETTEQKRAARDAFLSASPDLERSVPDSNKTLAGHAHVRVPGASAETMLILLDRMGVSASSGAACSSGSLEASHVLLACGYSEDEARQGLRFTFGHETTVHDAQEAANRVCEAAQQVLASRRS